jgi:hypothetical protein
MQEAHPRDRTMVDPDGISPGLAEQIQRLLDASPEFATGYRGMRRLLSTGVSVSPADVAGLVEAAARRSPPGSGGWG